MTKKLSPEAKALKYKLSALNSKKIRARKIKDDPSAYCPGMGKAFYLCRAWRDIRWDVLKENAAKNGGKPCCEMCGARAQLNKPLQVDHVLPRSKYPHLELTKSNLQVLCEDCNIGKSAKV